MTKKEQQRFIRRMDAIHRRGLRRCHRITLDTVRQLQALANEYQQRQFDTIRPARSKVQAGVRP